jgi:hypothetical protein
MSPRLQACHQFAHRNKLIKALTRFPSRSVNGSTTQLSVGFPVRVRWIFLALYSLGSGSAIHQLVVH